MKGFLDRINVMNVIGKRQWFSVSLPKNHINLINPIQDSPQIRSTTSPVVKRTFGNAAYLSVGLR
jgi:hypothetical protein